jgi:hypothetical protein
MDRLFVPLNSEPFEDFKDGSKSYELRSYGRQYIEKFAYLGRDVELRKGYSGDSLWGKIGCGEMGTLDEILCRVDWWKIFPKAGSKEEAINRIKKIVGIRNKYLAFEVIR